jgi:hypothetical protein
MQTNLKAQTPSWEQAKQPSANEDGGRSGRQQQNVDVLAHVNLMYSPRKDAKFTCHSAEGDKVEFASERVVHVNGPKFDIRKCGEK